jgi:hypothetical protein
VFRVVVVFFAPLILLALLSLLSLLAIMAAAIFQWIKDGYSKNPPANPN